MGPKHDCHDQNDSNRERSDADGTDSHNFPVHFCHQGNRAVQILHCKDVVTQSYKILQVKVGHLNRNALVERWAIPNSLSIEGCPVATGDAKKRQRICNLESDNRVADYTSPVPVQVLQQQETSHCCAKGTECGYDEVGKVPVVKSLRVLRKVQARVVIKGAQALGTRVFHLAI